MHGPNTIGRLMMIRLRNSAGALDLADFRERFSLISGRPMLTFLVERLKRCALIDRCILATTTLKMMISQSWVTLLV